MNILCITHIFKIIYIFLKKFAALVINCKEKVKRKDFNFFMCNIGNEMLISYP